MAQAHIGLLARGGDQLGHLVRGVQMMHSYGREFEILGNSSMYAGEDTRGPYLSAVIPVNTSAAKGELWKLCREVEWSLGGSQSEEAPAALSVQILLYSGTGNAAGDGTLTHAWIDERPDIRAALQEVGVEWQGQPAGDAVGAPVVHLGAAEFAAQYQLGQRQGNRGEEIIGRQPSGGGWPG